MTKAAIEDCLCPACLRKAALAADPVNTAL
jgi:hypothetical protein